MTIIFSLLASLISLYTIACIIRIVLTWIPQARSSKFEEIMSKICDPYLNIFSKIKWARIGTFDFSAAIGLCVLAALSSLFQTMGKGNLLKFSSFIGLLLTLVWSIFSSIMIFFILLLIVRLIILLVSKGSVNSNPVLVSIDYSLHPFLTKITRAFIKKDDYRARLIAGIIIASLFYLVMSIVFQALIKGINLLPF